MNFEDNYYRVYAQIDLDAVYRNTENLKKNTKPGTGLTAVIKTDGYGHGAVPVAYKINNLVDSYAVATIDEAINLISHNVTKPIYIIGFTHKSRVMDAIKNKIRLTVYDYELAEEISGQASLENKAYIHIKLDTGMNRIGFIPGKETIETIKRISLLPNIELEGIFTHFSCSDEKDKNSANLQLQTFLDVVKELEEAGISFPIKHTSNSAAIIDIKEANLTTVRAGISLYGLYPSNEVEKENVKLYPALSLKSHIIHLKEIEKGCGISYGSTFITERKTKVATIPVGYGDGYPRSLSSKGFVLVRGERAPIMGRVCMDQFMVDVTDINGVCNGDEVVLVGSQGADEITVDELSEISNRFPYEFVCDLGKRIPRVYISDEKVVCMKDYFDDKYKIKL